MNKLLIVRGIPGSGKSTMARALVEAGEYDVVCEADNFMVGEDGSYHFNPHRLQHAHTLCMNEVCSWLAKGKRVVVANTFTRLWEMEKYISWCKRFNIPFEVVEARGNYENIHGVPPEKVALMRERWEEYVE